MVDTSLTNKLIDGAVGIDQLPTDGRFVATLVQRGAFNRTKDADRRLALLGTFNEGIDEIIPTKSYIFGESRLVNPRGDGILLDRIKTDLDGFEQKADNLRDALIAEFAKKNGYILLCADFNLSQVACKHNIKTMHWSTRPESLPAKPVTS